MSTGLSLQHIDRLSACAVTKLVKRVKRGANIFAKGDPGTSIFAIGAGTVKITVPSVEGKDAVFNVLGKGDIFGEIALLDGHPRTADATAVTDCELYVIERGDFLPFMREEPEIALRLIEILCSRLRRTMAGATTTPFMRAYYERVAQQYLSSAGELRWPRDGVSDEEPGRH